MKRTTLILSAATLALGALAATATLAHGPGYGPGNGTGPMMDGSGYMQGQGNYHGHGHGYHGKGTGYGMGNENCMQSQALDTPLTVDDVRANLEKRLEWRGNDRLKVGTVEDKDENTITAEIVTVDDSLVRRIEIDKATGRHVPVN